MSGDAKQESQSWLSEIYTIQENFRSAHPFHVIYHVVFWGSHHGSSPPWLASIKCRRRTGLLCSSQSITSLSLPGLQQKIKWGKKFDSKNNFLLYSFFFPKSLAATAFQPVVRHLVDWSESGGGLGAVRPCVGPCGPLEVRLAFILRQD